jgi:HSP20 family protein
MSVPRWEPFNEVFPLRDVMSRLMESAYINPRSGLGGGGQQLAMDVYETPEGLVVRAAIPGVSPDRVDVSWERGTLTIRGTVPEPAPGGDAEKGTWHLRETFHGEFARSLQLAGAFDPEGAEAEYENGILTLRVPRSEAAKPRQIRVKSVGNPGQPATNQILTAAKK